MSDFCIIRAGEQFPGIDITQNLSRSSHFTSRLHFVRKVKKAKTPVPSSCQLLERRSGKQPD